MSLVSNYCYCSDGFWYKEANWRGLELPDGTSSWFICLDDDDPPEIVIQANVVPPTFDWFSYPRPEMKTEKQCTAKRVFKTEPWEFRWGHATFGRLVAVPPPPEQHQGKFEERPKNQGVYYDARDARS